MRTLIAWRQSRFATSCRTLLGIRGPRHPSNAASDHLLEVMRITQCNRTRLDSAASFAPLKDYCTMASNTYDYWSLCNHEPYAFWNQALDQQRRDVRRGNKPMSPLRVSPKRRINFKQPLTGRQRGPKEPIARYKSPSPCPSCLTVPATSHLSYLALIADPS